MSEPQSQNSPKDKQQFSFSKPPNLTKQKKSSSNIPSSKRESAIPKPVANRMARRIIITTGIPTFSGMGVFVGSYLIVSKGIADIAPGITLITSALCFLIGLIGLSYGILSASWDELPGSLLGFENIRPNIQRMRSAFKTESKATNN